MIAPTLEELAREAATVAESDGWAAACCLFSERFRGALEEGDVATAIRSLQRQAVFVGGRGDSEAAEDLAACALEIARAHSLKRLEARLVNYLGLLRFEQLDWAGASVLYHSALELAHADHDDELVAAICMNLGMINNILGRFAEARRLYLESLGAGVCCGDAARLVMTYNHLGMVCSDMEEWMEALVHLDRGLEIAADLNDDRLIALLYVNRAEPLIGVADSARALESLARAEALATDTGFASVLADVQRLRGIVAYHAGDLQGALDHVARALEIASVPNLLLSRAEALEERGRIHSAMGRAPLARENFEEAARLFTSLGAEHDQRRVAARLQQVGEEL